MEFPLKITKANVRACGSDTMSIEIRIRTFPFPSNGFLLKSCKITQRVKLGPTSTRLTSLKSLTSWRRPEDELIRVDERLLLRTPLHPRRRRTGGQLKMCVEAFKVDLDAFSRPQRLAAQYGESSGWEFLVSSHGPIEPGVHLPEVWLIPLVMPAQLVPVQYRHR